MYVTCPGSATPTAVCCGPWAPHLSVYYLTLANLHDVTVLMYEIDVLCALLITSCMLIKQLIHWQRIIHGEHKEAEPATASGTSLGRRNQLGQAELAWTGGGGFDRTHRPPPPPPPQPTGLLFISIACNFSYLSSTYTHSGEKQQHICNGQCNVFNLKHTSYVHRIIMKKLNCLRQNTQFVQSKIKVRLVNLCCHVTIQLSLCRVQC